MEPEKIESEFAYTLIRKNVKNINLTVKSDGSIVVSANPRVDERYIEDFISSKIPFIKKAREKLAQSKTNEKVSYESGSRIPYLGGFLTLQTAQADRRLVPEWIAQLQDGRITSFSRNNHGEAVFCRDGQLFMYAESGRDAAYRQQLFESWQKIQAGVL